MTQNGKKICFKKNINTSYMVIEEAAGFSPYHFKTKMLLQNEIPGLLNVGYENINGRYRLLYDISSRQSFAKIFETKKISFEQLKGLIFSLKGLMQSIRAYLLDVDNLILSQECIFLDAECRQYFYCYDPYYRGDLGAAVRRLVGELLSRVNYEEEQAVRLAYEMQAAVQTENFTINDLAGAYEKIASEGFSKVQKFLPPEEGDPVEAEENGAEEEALWEEEALFSALEEEPRFVRQAADYEEEEETTFFEKFRFYLKGKKMMDVLEDVNNREFLSKVRQCGRLPEPMDTSGPLPALLPEEKPPFSYLYPDSGSVGALLEEETRYMAERRNPAGTVLLSASGRQYHKLVGLGEQQGVRYVIRSFPFTIGKADRDCDACLDDDTVSRLHARIHEAAGAYYLEDLNSMNGTFLNEQRLSAYTRVPLKEGDVLRFADNEFCFRL